MRAGLGLKSRGITVLNVENSQSCHTITLTLSLKLYNGVLSQPTPLSEHQAPDASEQLVCSELPLDSKYVLANADRSPVNSIGIYSQSSSKDANVSITEPKSSFRGKQSASDKQVDSYHLLEPGSTDSPYQRAAQVFSGIHGWPTSPHYFHHLLTPSLDFMRSVLPTRSLLQWRTYLP